MYGEHTHKQEHIYGSVSRLSRASSKDAARLCAIRDSWQFKTRIFYSYKIYKQCKWTYSSNLHSLFNIRVNWCQFASNFFNEKNANHHESRI